MLLKEKKEKQRLKKSERMNESVEKKVCEIRKKSEKKRKKI